MDTATGSSVTVACSAASSATNAFGLTQISWGEPTTWQVVVIAPPNTDRVHVSRSPSATKSITSAITPAPTFNRGGEVLPVRAAGEQDDRRPALPHQAATASMSSEQETVELVALRDVGLGDTVRRQPVTGVVEAASDEDHRRIQPGLGPDSEPR